MDLNAQIVYFLQQVINGIQLGSVYALIALGYTMVYGIVRLINFAHGDVFMVGAFAGFFAVSVLGLSFLPAIILAMIVSMVLGVTIERLAYRPLRRAPKIAALITAIGVSIFLEYFTSLNFVFGPNYRTFPRPFEVTSWNIGGVAISNILVIILGVSLFLVVALQLFVTRTKVGIAMRAVSFDHDAARLMGINVDTVISITFAIGSALAGAGGVLFAIAYPQVDPFMGIMPGLKAFVAAVLGGIGIIPGALLGSLIMGQAEVLTTGYVSSTLRDLVAFGILIIVLLVRPTGLLGKSGVEKV
ncbi:MAG: branched-chain amino acid ABC transporter permease [Chloroflexi bacterium]|nr:branched-chain amino acid ABC transporter permease [Chloroflexota bacterium]MDA8219936.1 branched-chain amino acid ABC transporter permease [Dehalococcoidales bacterium]